MNQAPRLHWLPEDHDWRVRLKFLRAAGRMTWADAVAMANRPLDFTQTNMLDCVFRQAFARPPQETGTKPERLAILGSSTLAHLHAGIRMAALRRSIHVTTYENDFGQYRQELVDAEGRLHAFRPTAVLFAFDARHVTAGIHADLSGPDVDAALRRVEDDLAECWRLARDAFGCPVLQQSIVPVFGSLIGSNEHRLPGSRADFVRRLNVRLRDAADSAGVQIVAVDQRVTLDGLGSWHDVALWHRSKQEILLGAAPMYGELVARVLAANQGRVSKCLVLDLDNTVWGGVVGDDGVDGLVLGQGSALGESYVAVQDYAKDLSRRGIILAVCSKNDEVNALEAFDRHPEMVLRRSDIACFVANWTDKAANLRAVAVDLNIGLDSLVFLDDNPAERSLVRDELPMVAVPEVGDDPAYFPQILMDAGYFESLGITKDDRERNQQYQSNRLREDARASATDLPSYLRGLGMTLIWRRFDRAGLTRNVQLINKTNQFNLTTRRYTEEEVVAVMDDPAAVGLQLRLVDRFGDNGIIGVVIGRRRADALSIDTWLMSCRVLGRQVEAATLNLLVEQARSMGADRLLGHFMPTAKNGMVRDHYAKLGFAPSSSEPGGASTSILDLDDFTFRDTAILLQQG